MYPVFNSKTIMTIKRNIWIHAAAEIYRIKSRKPYIEEMLRESPIEEDKRDNDKEYTGQLWPTPLLSEFSFSKSGYHVVDVL